MATITQSLSSMENTQYFQIELFTLLGSLLLSILLNNSWPCFIISAICFFAADSALMVESYQNVLAGSLDQASAITEASMAVILLATFVYALTKRMEPRLVKAHAATTLIFSIYLAVNGSHLWEGSVGLITSGLDRYEVQASGFAAMHFFSTLLMLYDSLQHFSRSECEYDEKIASIV